MKIEYFQTSFETKVNLADAFISDLTVKYCEQQMKMNQPRKALEFSSKVYKVQEVFISIRSVFRRAENDNNKLLKENAELKKRLHEYERTDKALNELKPNTELEAKYRDEMLSFKDKYQMRIQELEIENDQLLKQLIKLNQNT